MSKGQSSKPMANPSGRPSSKTPGGNVNGSVDGVKVSPPPKKS
ncbi:hypothetical protein [Alkalihalobacterium alkalinitrilicum]|nr:hypothetical protein [Alkalihalobacterium alkalinitrilicum]